MLALTLFLALALAPIHVACAEDAPQTDHTTVIVNHGAAIPDEQKDFEIVSGTDDVLGDPVSGRKDAYASWKSACSDWKKEMKEMNRANQLISLSCGAPGFSRDNGFYTFKSQGTYRMRVRIRGTESATSHP
jgi:hypothetical protein